MFLNQGDGRKTHLLSAGPPTGGGGGQLGQFAPGPLYEGGLTAKNGFEISGPAAILSISY